MIEERLLIYLRGRASHRGTVGVLAALYSSQVAGRLTVVGFGDSLDALTQRYQSAVGARAQLSSTTGAWLGASSNDSLSGEALGAIRSAVDATEGAGVAIESYLSSVLGSTSAPFLVPEVFGPEGPILAADTCTITVVVRNVGGGAAAGDSLVLTAADGDFAFLDQPRAYLPSIGPGEAGVVSWRVRVMASPVPDSLLTLEFSVRADSGSSAGMVASGIVQAAFNPALLAVGAGERSPFALALLENPGRGQLGIEFSLTRPQAVELSVFDVAGRRVYESRIHVGAGSHVLDWKPGVSGSALAPSGVYFVRLRAEEGRRTVRAVLLR